MDDRLLIYWADPVAQLADISTPKEDGFNRARMRARLREMSAPVVDYSAQFARAGYWGAAVKSQYSLRCSKNYRATFFRLYLRSVLTSC